eukprot:scaffold46953_cov62-Phaeocystis_antarctica.AAC.10
MVTYLLTIRSGASPDTRSSTWFSTVRGDASGQTAAHWAAAGGHTAALDALLSARPASLLQADERDHTPGGVAAAAGHGWLQSALTKLETEKVVPVRTSLVLALDPALALTLALAPTPPLAPARALALALTLTLALALALALTLTLTRSCPCASCAKL